MADNFKLPGSSYDEIIKIVKAYSSGKEGQAQTLDSIAQSTGMDRTVVSRNNGFLMQMELLTEGNKKTPTQECFSLGRAYTLGIQEEIQKVWRQQIEKCEFLTRMISAIRIRNGMDKTALCNHILYSAGSTTSAAKVGANTIIEIFKASGLVTEEDGKIVAVNMTEEAVIADSMERNDEVREKQVTKKITSVEKKSNTNNIININININASVDEIDMIGEKLKKMFDAINE